MPTSLIFFLARRNLAQDRLRTLVSVVNVALGTAVVIAADFVGAAIRRAGEEMSEGGTVPFVSEFLNVSLSLTGLIILLVAAFLIFNVFGMSVTQRRRQMRPENFGGKMSLRAAERKSFWKTLSARPLIVTCNPSKF
jgi:hypothetical protein